MKAPLAACIAVCLTFATLPAQARQPIRLASTPALSPDGAQLAFSWRGDIWIVKSTGGIARRLTVHPDTDAEPKFSPDGGQLAFTSDRSGSRQVYVMGARGGTPRQVTFHTEGHSLQGWFPDGKTVLTSAVRDHFWRHAERFCRVAVDERKNEELLFDAYGGEGALSADANRLLFTREGTRWWRKGYRGAQSSQVWLCNLNNGKFTEVVQHASGCRSPLWHPDGKSFYYVSGQSGAFNLWRRQLKGGDEEQLTHFEDDSVVNPCISADGSTIVFRHLFDFYRLRPGEDDKPQKLAIFDNGDATEEPTLRRTLQAASDVAFTKDGLEIAFIAGGDLWVMDTELREPRQVTDTPEEESDPTFAPDGKSIFFASEMQGQSDLWKATRADEEAFWWQNDEFPLTRLTEDADVEADLKWSPTGELLAFQKGNGDLWVIKPDGKDARRVLAGWDGPDYDWSPDGKWLVYAVNDNDFNADVWLQPLDGSREPFNLSRHPDNESGPAWSPDGKAIAFTGRRFDTEVDIYFVYLAKEEDETDARQRKLEKAIEKIEKARKDAKDAKKKPEEDKEKKEKPAEVRIDFDGIHERLRRVSIPNSAEGGLFWSHDSKKLAFTATVDGKRGTYTISPPDDLKPKLLSTTTGRSARWISQGNQIVWLANNVPASLSASGAATPYGFSALQTVDLKGRFAAGFDQCWRAMRDYFYDGALNNRNWDAIRRKYAPMAAEAGDMPTFERVVSLMLGELNGSHLGFRGSRAAPASSRSPGWNETTAHLGLRFQAGYQGPGLKVRDVIPESPADKEASKIVAGEIVLSIDGATVDPGMDLSMVLNGPMGRDIELKVRNAEGEEREVTLRPISYAAARALLYEAWMEGNRQQVAKASQGKLGYLHIRAMNMSSFHRFERELYAVGAGKDGLVIDVRENGGGFTTDHLLTALTQPKHAITVPRGGGPGYPQDRRVYATWNKPIVVLCNQNSFSNAEIFSHAIKTLERGKLVGVPTAGAVISTGARRIMDLGALRMPFRGWFVAGTGEDMELNGAVPHHVLWPAPGQMPRGKDVQLEKAIQVLQIDVKKWQNQPRPDLTKASERRGEAN